MKCYSFRVKNLSELQKVIEKLSDNNAFWLREELDQKTISKCDESRAISYKDWEGRIFSEDYEFRYKHHGNDYKCLFTTKVDEEWPHQQVACKQQEIAFVSKEPRAYYVENLKAIVKGESVFRSKEAQLLMKEFVFTDEVGGKGYFLCGVR